MGRHAAGDGAGVDPIVAAALSLRPTGTEPGIPRHGHEAAQSSTGTDDGEGALGWPGEPGDGTGLGWPTDRLTETQPALYRRPVGLRIDDGPGGVPDETSDEAPAPRRGWRRLFGSGSAGERGDQRSGSSAA